MDRDNNNNRDNDNNNDDKYYSNDNANKSENNVCERTNRTWLYKYVSDNSVGRNKAKSNGV